MADSADRQWDHATLTINPTRVEATFDYPDQHRPAPIVVDIEHPHFPPRTTSISTRPSTSVPSAQTSLQAFTIH